MNYLDLFSGIGGFAIGAHWAGMKFDKHYFSEIEPFAVELYQKRFPDAIPLGDIKEINCEELADADRKRGIQSTQETRCEEYRRAGNDGKEWIITGGFPCQDISVAGAGAGIRGSRSGLWFEYWRIIRELRPRYAIMENVGALTFRGLTDVLGSLAEIGYDAEWQDIRAEDMGAPHRRERIWIVAYPAGSGRSEAELWRQEPSGIAGEATEPADSDNPGGTCGRSDSGMGLQQTDKGQANSGARQRVDQWATEPDVGRLAHGIPRRVDRLKGLGNAIVPQIAELLFSQIGKLYNNEGEI